MHTHYRVIYINKAHKYSESFLTENTISTTSLQSLTTLPNICDLSFFRLIGEFSLRRVKNSCHTIREMIVRLTQRTGEKKHIRRHLKFGFAKGCRYLCSTGNQIIPHMPVLLKHGVDFLGLFMALSETLGPRHYVCFPFTEPGLYKHQRFFSANTEQTARGPWGAIS